MVSVDRLSMSTCRSGSALIDEHYTVLTTPKIFIFLGMENVSSRQPLMPEKRNAGSENELDLLY